MDAARMAIEYYGTGRYDGKRNLPEQALRDLAAAGKAALLADSSYLEVEGPVVVVGCIHGQLSDLKKIFEKEGAPGEGPRYLFLGNFAGKGQHPLQTVALLIAYKVLHPDDVLLLRGSQEMAHFLRVDGLRNDIEKVYGGVAMWKGLQGALDCLPFAACVEGKVFCVHSGLSHRLVSLQQLRELPRPSHVPEDSLEMDLLWSCPDGDGVGWCEPGCRAVSIDFGPDIVEAFCAKHGFDLIVRSHQVVEEGYEFFCNKKLVTIFSVPDFIGEFDNAGCYMKVTGGLACSFHLLRKVSKASAAT